METISIQALASVTGGDVLYGGLSRWWNSMTLRHGTLRPNGSRGQAEPGWNQPPKVVPIR